MEDAGSSACFKAGVHAKCITILSRNERNTDGAISFPAFFPYELVLRVLYQTMPFITLTNKKVAGTFIRYSDQFSVGYDVILIIWREDGAWWQNPFGTGTQFDKPLLHVWPSQYFGPHCPEA